MLLFESAWMLRISADSLKSVDARQLPAGAKLVDWPVNVDVKMTVDTNEQRRLFRGAASVGFRVYYLQGVFYFVENRHV